MLAVTYWYHYWQNSFNPTIALSQSRNKNEGWCFVVFVYFFILVFGVCCWWDPDRFFSLCTSSAVELPYALCSSKHIEWDGKVQDILTIPHSDTRPLIPIQHHHEKSVGQHARFCKKFRVCKYVASCIQEFEFLTLFHKAHQNFGEFSTRCGSWRYYNTHNGFWLQLYFITNNLFKIIKNNMDATLSIQSFDAIVIIVLTTTVCFCHIVITTFNRFLSWKNSISRLTCSNSNSRCDGKRSSRWNSRMNTTNVGNLWWRLIRVTICHECNQLIWFGDDINDSDGC